MFSFLSPEKLARRSARHPWITIGVWALVIVLAMAAATTTKISHATDSGDSEAARAMRLVEQLHGPMPARETVIVASTASTVDDPAFRAFVEGLVAEIRALEGVVTMAHTHYEMPDAGLASADGSKTLIPVFLAAEAMHADSEARPLFDLLAKANGRDGFEVLTVGDGSLNRELMKASQDDLKRSEIIGLPAALVVLVVVFGAAVAAGIPVVIGILGIVVAMGITGALSNLVGINSYVHNMIVMIGLAVGIDYTLFIIERVREERRRGLAKIDAIVAAGSTASRAVLFSGITVIIALTSLLIVPDETFHGLSIGAVTAVVGAVAGALTLLPAVLSLLGDKINSLRLPGVQHRVQIDNENGFWGRASRQVMRHPVIAIVCSVALLLALAAPVTTMKLGTPGISDMPASLSSVRAFNILDQDFGAGRLAPTRVVVEGDPHSPAVQGAVNALRQKLATDTGFAEVGRVMIAPDRNVGGFEVILAGEATSKEARAAVERLRSQYIPEAFEGVDATVLVGGATAFEIDYVASMVRYLPLVIGFVLALSFLLLTVVFRSVVIPVKAMAMNLLSVGASYGLIVLVFQHGVGAEIFGFRQVETVVAWLPVFLFAVLFGLSMDYHVFLLTRIQERFQHTGDNRGSVSFGLRSTAHIITGAAAIMVVVFGAFAVGELVALQQLGFGLAVAVFIDATIIRSVLVPASMEMLGRLNWYFPSWLNWLPRLNIEGVPTTIGAPSGAEAAVPVYLAEAAGMD